MPSRHPQPSVQIGVNANTKPTRNCKFCELKSHIITGCPIRSGYQTQGYEYNVHKAAEVSRLSCVIVSSVPVIYLQHRCQTVTALSATQLQRHTILHKTYSPNCLEIHLADVNTLLFKVSLIQPDGTIDLLKKEVIVSGEVMSQLIHRTSASKNPRDSSSMMKRQSLELDRES